MTNCQIFEDRHGSLIDIKITGPTVEKVSAVVESYKNNYPPAGYETLIREPKQQPDGTFVATGYRSASCD